MASTIVDKYSKIGPDLDMDWYLSDKQREFKNRLIHACLTEIRPHAIELDECRQEFPWRSLRVLAKMGLLGMIVPKELGGMAENHRFAAMVCETVARYGCPSTAMVFVMHTLAISTMCFRYHNNDFIKDCLRKCNEPEPYLGTTSYSDPATGTHFWFPFSSKVQETKDGYQVLKYGSWCTSAGFAKWYTMQALSPNHGGDGSNLSVFLLDKDIVRANTSEWQALGMHGNQSGPLVAEGLIEKGRLIGSIGEGAISNDECVDPIFLLLSSSVWNGLSLALMDLARKHVLRREHVDTGMRVADYPTIQDYFGESVSGVASTRHFVMSMANRFDAMTDDGNWDRFIDPTFLPRTTVLTMCYGMKFEAAKALTRIGDTMLHACGGLGYKKQLGLERLLRDSKAAWVMGPSNETCRQIVGQVSVFGGHYDYWSQHSNSRLLTAELRKLSSKQKIELAKQLMVENQDFDKSSGKEEVEDFYNPLVPPGSGDKAATAKYSLVERRQLVEGTEELVLKPEKGSGLNLKCGQYVEVDVSDLVKSPCKRYLSPTSPPGSDELSIAVKYEGGGLLSDGLKMLRPGGTMVVNGPCGGFEYSGGKIGHLVLICSGVGITPAIQILRSHANQANDSTKITLFFHAETPEELLYREEIDQLSAKASKSGRQVKVHYCVSESTSEPTLWEGYVGQEMLESHLQLNGVGTSRIVLCGGPSMVLATLYSLRTLGHPSQIIYIYGPFATEFLRKVYGRNAQLMQEF